MPSLSAAAPWLPVTRLARSPSQNCEMTASCGRKRKITREAERQALLPGSPARPRTARNPHPIRHARPRPRWAESTRWDARVIQVWSAILIVAGALILAVELKPPPGHPAAAARRPPGHRRRADPRRAGWDPARRSHQH